MAVPVNFLRNKNPNFNLRGALKVNAIFATDDAVGTEPFQGYLADNTVVTSFNDALIENNIGVVDTDGFNIVQSNRFAFTTMSEGQRIVRQNFVRVTFSSPIDPTNGTFNSGDLIEFESNLEPFGSLQPPSSGKQYRIYSVVREKDIQIDAVNSITDNLNGTWTVVLDTDFREDLQEYSPQTSTGNNFNEGDKVVIFGNALNSGGATSLNGTYSLDAVTSTSITYTTTSDPLNGSSVSYTGKLYKITNELILIETLRGVASPVSYNSGTSVVNVTGVLSGSIRSGQEVTGTGVPAGTIVISYNSVTGDVNVSNNFTTTVGGGTLTFELLDSQTDVVVPVGAVAAPSSAQMFIDAGVVTESITVKTPINYYVYGDTRLKYFWSSYTQDGTFNGWTQNVNPDGFQTLYEGGTVGSGTTLQLIGSDPAFATEDTFNNLIKTLGFNRSTGLAGDYSPVGRSALLYISATDSQGDTGGGGGPKRGTSTPAYTVSETIDYLNQAGGYWIGVIGGSLSNGCQNEIQTFRQDTTDGISGDPRGFIPIKGEVTSVRVGVPVENIFYETVGQTINTVVVPSGSVVVQTYYDHALGSPNDALRIRFKNNTNAPFDVNGLRDVVVISDNQFYFPFPDDVGTLSNVTDYDECGYILNITTLLTVPVGFYRKSTFEYVDSTTLNDSRSVVATGDGFTLSQPPGLGFDRKEILVTIGVTESTGTLQFFSMYPVGDFFSLLPEGSNIPYFAYPLVGLDDIKFRIKTTNVGSNEFITVRDAETTPNDLLDPGTTEVTPRTEFPIVLYPIEYTANVIATNSSTEIVVDTLEIFEGNGADGRDFTLLTNGGSTYDDGTGEDTFSASNVTTTNTSGTGTGLKFSIQVVAGVITNATIVDRGSGYQPGDTGTIDAAPGGTVGVGNEATFLIKSIDDSTYAGLNWTLEIITTPSSDNFFTLGDNWTNPSILSSKTQVEVNTITETGGQYTLTLSKPLVGAITGSEVAFCFPNDFRRLNVFVKPSNNFKDINAEAAIGAGLVPATSDASITFSGYGYGKGDILTPVEVFNLPASISTAVWTRDTEISQEGFLVTGQSVGTGGPFNIINVDGNFEGEDASFEITPTPIGLYNVVLTDPGSNFQVTESIVIGGYLLGGSRIPTFALTSDRVISATLTDPGTGYTPSSSLTDVATTPDLFNNNGDGTLSFNFTTDASGIINSGLTVNNGGSSYEVGDTGTIDGGTATYEITAIDPVANTGAGYTPDSVFTNQSTTVLTGSGDGTLTFDFETTPGGSIDINTLSINTPGDGYEIGDLGEITGGTTNAIYEIQRTENDCVIKITEIIDNSNVLVETVDPHGFVPALGRTTVDILVEGVVATTSAGSFNGRKVAEIIDGSTLKFDQAVDPGTYISGGTIFNVSPDVVNDTFASFKNELFLNINVTPNNPSYPKIVFIDSVSYASPTVTVTTSTDHKFTSGENVQISGMNFTRVGGEELNVGNVEITVTASNQFTYDLSPFPSGNLGNHIPGTGQATNPFAKVLGGVYTKDFFRIVFVNTSNVNVPLVDDNLDPVPGEFIEPDKTRDFLVRDINFKQISNDGNEVTDGPKHDFYITNSNQLAIIARGKNNINPVVFTNIDYLPETLEFEVTTNVDHGLWPGNYFDMIFDGNNQVGGVGLTATREQEYIPGTNEYNEVSLRLSSTVFRYKVYSAGRDETNYSTAPGGDPRDTSDITDGGDGLGRLEKFVDVGTGDFDTFTDLDGTVATNLIKFSGLKGFPGVQPDEAYYLVTTDDERTGGEATQIRLQISNQRSGSPISFTLSIVGATYNRSTEEARIDVSGLTPHGLVAGDTIRINGVSSNDYNGIQTLAFVVSPTSFTYSLPAISGIADTTNDTFTKDIISGTTDHNQVSKAINGNSGTNIIEIRNRNNRTGFDGDLIEGMLVDPSNNLSAIPVGSYITDTTLLASQGLIEISQNLTGNIGGGNTQCLFQAGVPITVPGGQQEYGAIALANTGTFPGADNVVAGQTVSGTGIGTNAKVLKVVSWDDPNNPGIKAFAVVDKVHTQALNSANTFTFEDNQAGGRSVRVRDVTGGIPQVGAEIETDGGSGNVFSAGTLIIDVTPYSIGGVDGYVIGVDSDLLVPFTNQTLKIYPDENPTVSSATVSPLTTEFTPDGVNPATQPSAEDYILDPTAISGQLQLTADVVGWDHVSLARETGGAIFFQLGFPLLCSGTVNQNTITIAGGQDFSDLTALVGSLGADTVGVYGEGIAPGATINNIAGSVITLSTGFNNVTTFTNEYVGFARPNSVSVFPKYTSEFGRILGKTFAEWLFKIA